MSLEVLPNIRIPPHVRFFSSTITNEANRTADKLGQCTYAYGVDKAKGWRMDSEESGLSQGDKNGKDNSNDVSAVAGVSGVDKFKASFKRYKRLSDTVTAIQDVFDGDAIPEVPNKFQFEVVSPIISKSTKNPKNASPEVTYTNSGELKLSKCINCREKSYFGLKPYSEWTILKFHFPEGLIFIRNPFTVEGQRYWISKCVYDYPNNSEHITNIGNLKRRSITTKDTSDSVEEEGTFFKKLRWTTFGFHHDWDTKIYSEKSRCKFPDDLAELTKYIALVLAFNNFNAEAAIVNYYNMDSTLSGHQDRSEAFQTAPLFSISFGQSAIFLIGGETKEVEPLPIYLKSGDIVIMSGKSRLSYHGVPKIVKCTTVPTPWTNLESSIQVSDNITCFNSPESGPQKKRIKMDNSSEEDCANFNKCSVCSFLSSCRINLSEDQGIRTVIDKWNKDKFLSNYASRCRINLNIRQVLFPGQTVL